MAGALIYSLIAGVFVGLASGYIGSLMVLKKMALVGDALSHVALPGLALGILLNFNPFIGAFAFLFVAAIITWYVERSTELSAEAIIGTLFVLALAIGILITPEPDLLEALFGDITKVTLTDATIAVGISLIVIVATRLLYDKVILSLLSEELAVSKGVNVARVNFAYLFLVTLVVASGIKLVGSLLVGALVIIPAAATKNVSKNLRTYGTMSSVFGVVSVSAGVLIGGFTTIPAGPLVVLSGTAIFMGALVVRRLI